MTTFTDAELLKFHLLESGVRISPAAGEYLANRARDIALTAADYASTSGIILKLSGDVWVNAPIEAHNPNFVSESRYWLDIDSDGLWCRAVVGLRAPGSGRSPSFMGWRTPMGLPTTR